MCVRACALTKGEETCLVGYLVAQAKERHLGTQRSTLCVSEFIYIYCTCVIVSFCVHTCIHYLFHIVETVCHCVLSTLCYFLN